MFLLPQLGDNAAIIERQTGYFGDDGTDPILGPPFAPVFYQLLLHQEAIPPQSCSPLNARLTWTVPDVFITATGIVIVEGLITTLRIVLTNYHFPDWDIGTPYITNARVLYGGNPYLALRDTTGDQPDESPSDWALDTTSYVLYRYNAGNATKDVRGVSADLPSAAGFFQTDMYQNQVSFYNDNYSELPGFVWLVAAVQGAFLDTGPDDIPFVNGTSIAYSQLITV